MERVAFLLESTGERIPCLLNPASVVVRRLAGIRTRESSSGPLTGATLKDDPLLYTGGGMTELLLDLLFDVSLVSEEPPVEDVRDLTRPLTDLAEGTENDGDGQIPKVRFVWGKSWNVLGVVTAVAERLEYFTAAGAPQRSWLRMRFLRITDDATTASTDEAQDLLPEDLPDEINVPHDQLDAHQVMGVGDTPDSGSSTERLDEIAAAHYGNPAYWRLIAAFNDIDDPWSTSAGQVLMIPPESALGDKS